MTNRESIADLFTADSAELIEQSVIKLTNCLEQLSPKQIWWRANPESNSVGNLILHICGNLRQWIVAGVLGEPDVRDRDGEFSDEHLLNADELMRHLRTETEVCLAAIRNFGLDELLAEYTIQGFCVNGLQAVNHTVTHFVGHTHQVIFITRLQLGANYRFAWTPDDGRDRLPI